VYPLLSREHVKLRTSNLVDNSKDPSEQKPFKNLGEKGAWAYPGTFQIYGVHPIISGMDKATIFKFGRYIHRGHPNKSPLKIWEKRERGPIQGVGLLKFLKYPLLSQERVKLRTQSVHVNKSPLIIWEKRDRGRIQGLPIFEYPLLSQVKSSQVYSV